MNGHQFCSCGRPIHENECYHDEKEFKDLIETEKIKNCPKCGFLIKKMRGCNHMTCGNPICKYEFCWLCMNEAVPGHYEFGPCAGRQFFDPDSFSYRLEQNHPYLSLIYETFKFIIGFIFFILFFVVIPGIGLAIISYEIIYDFEELRSEINNKIIEFFLFLICICIGLCSQSLLYISWGIVISIALILFTSIIIGLILSAISYFITYIIKSIFCPDLYNDNNNEILNNSINIGMNNNNDIELANVINHNDNDNDNDNNN